MSSPRWPGFFVVAVGLATFLPAGHSYSAASERRSAPPGTELILQERDQEAQPLELLHAGEVEIRTISPDSGEPYRVTDLADSVLFRHGDQYILSDKATYLDLQEQVILTGRVRGWDPDWEFQADEVVYRSQERLLTTRGNVNALKLRDSTRVRAGEIRFDRESGDGVATGFPRLFQPPGDSSTHATELEGSDDSRLFFRRDAGWAEIDRGAILRRGDIIINGEWLRTEEDPQRLIVREMVELRKEGVNASGDHLVWDETGGLARLTGESPTLNRRAAREEGSLDSVMTSMVADSLDLMIEEDILKSILLHGQGEMTTVTVPEPGTVRILSDSTEVPAQPDHMRLVGSNITIALDSEQLDRLTAERGAMYYWRQDLPDRASALGGMELDITFIGGEPEIVEARGNAVTRYFTDLEAVAPDLVRMMASLVRFTLEDGAFSWAHLETGEAKMYSYNVVMAGIVPMAVHPDSVRVGAARTGGSGSPPPG